MATASFRITDGPDKPALQWAVTYPTSEEIHFRLEDASVDARVERMEEHAEGFTFALQGTLTSGDYKGFPFQAVYSVGTRSGTLTVLGMAGAAG